jgi:hypothetical protein
MRSELPGDAHGQAEGTQPGDLPQADDYRAVIRLNHASSSLVHLQDAPFAITLTLNVLPPANAITA